jgi:hypothetical protein
MQQEKPQIAANLAANLAAVCTTCCPIELGLLIGQEEIFAPTMLPLFVSHKLRRRWRCSCWLGNDVGSCNRVRVARPPRGPRFRQAINFSSSPSHCRTLAHQRCRLTTHASQSCRHNRCSAKRLSIQAAAPRQSPSTGFGFGSDPRPCIQVKGPSCQTKLPECKCNHHFLGRRAR